MHVRVVLNGVAILVGPHHAEDLARRHIPEVRFVQSVHHRDAVRHLAPHDRGPRPGLHPVGGRRHHAHPIVTRHQALEAVIAAHVWRREVVQGPILILIQLDGPGAEVVHVRVVLARVAIRVGPHHAVDLARRHVPEVGFVQSVHHCDVVRHLSAHCRGPRQRLHPVGVPRHHAHLIVAGHQALEAVVATHVRRRGILRDPVSVLIQLDGPGAEIVHVGVVLERVAIRVGPHHAEDLARWHVPEVCHFRCVRNRYLVPHFAAHGRGSWVRLHPVGIPRHREDPIVAWRQALKAIVASRVRIRGGLRDPIVVLIQFDRPGAEVVHVRIVLERVAVLVSPHDSLDLPRAGCRRDIVN